MAAAAMNTEDRSAGLPLPPPELPVEGEFMWAYCIIGTEQIQRWICVVDGKILCPDIPDSDYDALPPKQIERYCSDRNAYLILGNYPSLKYVPVLRSECLEYSLFVGPASSHDVMLVKKMMCRTQVFNLSVRHFSERKCITFWARMASGELVTEQGFEFPTDVSVWPKHVMELIVAHLEYQGRALGPNVEIKLLGTDMRVLKRSEILWDKNMPAQNGKKYRIPMKQAPALIALLRKVPAAVFV